MNSTNGPWNVSMPIHHIIFIIVFLYFFTLLSSCVSFLCYSFFVCFISLLLFLRVFHLSATLSSCVSFLCYSFFMCFISLLLFLHVFHFSATLSSCVSFLCYSFFMCFISLLLFLRVFHLLALLASCVLFCYVTFNFQYFQSSFLVFFQLWVPSFSIPGWDA